MLMLHQVSQDGALCWRKWASRIFQDPGGNGGRNESVLPGYLGWSGLCLDNAPQNRAQWAALLLFSIAPNYLQAQGQEVHSSCQPKAEPGQGHGGGAEEHPATLGSQGSLLGWGVPAGEVRG